MIDDILAELEADTSIETGAQFAAVTARYLENTRRGEGRYPLLADPKIWRCDSRKRCLVRGKALEKSSRDSSVMSSATRTSIAIRCTWATRLQRRSRPGSERSDFENIHQPESNIMCFRYLGNAREGSRIDAMNRELRMRYNRDGTGWITATVLDGRPVLRVTMMNARTGAEHVRALLDGLVAQAKKIEDGGH